MKKIIQVSIAISIFLAMFLLPIFVLVWQGDFVVQKVAVLQTSNLSDADAKLYTEQALGFLLGNSNLPSQMTSAEVAHMQDVKNLFVTGEWLLAISVLILVLSYFILKNPQTYWRGLRVSSVLAIIIIILLGMTMLSNFENIFIHFHQIFFPQGNWTFPTNSLMIQIFPESLFKWLGMVSAFTSLLSAIIVLIFSQYKIKNGNKI